MRPLSTTSYAVLGLLAVRPWTTYELAQQMKRRSAFWPRAESKLYEEPKKLVAHGYATARRERTGRRPRTVYRITPKGRRALGRWLGEPPAPLQIQFEGLLKTFFAEHGTKEQLLTTLRRIREDQEERLAQGLAVGQEYRATGGGPFPERLHVIALTVRFLLDLSMTVHAWAAWAEREVERWRDVTRPARAADAIAILDRVERDIRALLGQSEPAGR